MPRRNEPMLGGELLDAYRAFAAEIYDELAAAGFPDLPQSATTVFRDMDGRGSLVTDLAVQAGMSRDAMAALVAQLAERGYVDVDGDTVRPAERGYAALAAGRVVLAAAEERLARRVGAERLETFRAVLREMATKTSSGP